MCVPGVTTASGGGHATVRYNATVPKQVLEIFRALLDKALAAIAAQFSRKNAATLSPAGVTSSWTLPKR